MAVPVRSFAKINLGLCIGMARADGFHELRTVYQTIALHDVVRVDVTRGTGIEIRCKDPRVPQDESNTCWRAADRVMRSLKKRGKVVIQIDKQLPVQGGLGAASSNAVATMLGLERALKETLEPEERLRIAAEVGSDLPLFLVGGTVLGIGRGEQVFPLEDLSELNVVVVTPKTGVSTPQAFADWDELNAGPAKLTAQAASDRINGFSNAVFAWLTGALHTGVPADCGDRAGKTGAPGRGKVARNGELAPLLDLVRAGIVNDFERVVFPAYPELREVKRALEREGARYASLSGSGSTLYGLFETGDAAAEAAQRLARAGLAAIATTTVSRKHYWEQIFAD